MVNFDSRRVTGAALLSGMYAATDRIKANTMVHAAATLGGDSELGAIARGAVGIGAAALLKGRMAVLRLESLLTHLLSNCRLPSVYCLVVIVVLVVACSFK